VNKFFAWVYALVGSSADRSPEIDSDRAFWNWFINRAPALAKKPSLLDVMEQVQRELDRRHRGVICEFGPAGTDLLFVLSADGDRKL
jgi:hypothetical protein